LHGNLPITASANAKDQRRSAIPSMAVRQFFRPCVLAVLALAVVVGGGGYGYKLSQYRHLSRVTRPSATRMWVEHRDDSFGAPLHHQHQPRRLLSSQFFALIVPQLPLLSRHPVSAAPVQSRILTFVSPLHPLRAPPSFLSALA
jgi:hypothetical protein